MRYSRNKEKQRVIYSEEFEETAARNRSSYNKIPVSMIANLYLLHAHEIICGDPHDNSLLRSPHFVFIETWHSAWLIS
jgi:hypothetical protein